MDDYSKTDASHKGRFTTSVKIWKARFLLPLLIPLLLGFATLHVITTLVIFVIVLVICSSIVITVAPTTCSLEKAFISKFSDRYKGLISDPYVIYKCFLVTLFSWYFTMLVPVNLENKLLYKEILVYNILFVICVHLVQIVRNRHSSGLLHLLPSSSQHYPVNPVKREKNLTLFGLWKHTFHLLQDTNKQQMEGDWYFSWLDIFVNRQIDRGQSLY
ncbi:unnamed protein product [Heterobilharzia americana]|nr:unnamed protein product [Heterobilharzia americana]